jgi:hypothetical protein
MKKILIIAQNQAKATQAQSHLSGSFTFSSVFPGTSSFPRTFDAVVIYTQEPSEINFIKDLITRYQDAPVKVFLGKDI